MDYAKTTATKYAGKALKSETGQRVSGFLASTWSRAKGSILDLFSLMVCEMVGL